MISRPNRDIGFAIMIPKRYEAYAMQMSVTKYSWRDYDVGIGIGL